MTSRDGRPVRAVPEPRSGAASFWPVELVVTLGGQLEHLAICGSCAALVPSGDKAQARHREFHATVDSALPR